MRLRICTYLFCCLTGACAVTPTDRPTSPYEIRFVPVTADITLAYRPDVPRFPVVGNAVIVPIDGGVVLVDGGGADAVVGQILAYLRANKLGPIWYLVLSHWHSDHSVGIGRYLEIYPDAVIISHPWTRKRIVERLIDRVEVMAENLEREAITAREELATGHSGGGSPLHSAMQRLLEFDFEYLVLGHGPVQFDRTYGETVLKLQRHTVAEIYRLQAPWRGV